MRALSALLRHDDIVGRIMTFCPTFDSLQSATLVSKAFYCVFQTYPKAGGFSITRAVAYNIVGPALPQALRVLRYPYPWDDEDGSSMDPITLATTCPENHDASSVITAEEKIYLQENSNDNIAERVIQNTLFGTDPEKMAMQLDKSCVRDDISVVVFKFA
ncbi:hypothetical protein B0H13DRAFT_2301499 [Mycena leptocephala]|nr:hypothetical protein B0H13DRAFT_2301499 [Mycena leptocephala]